MKQSKKIDEDNNNFDDFNPLSGKTVLLGISGGIAAYKACDVASALRKAGADVHAVHAGLIDGQSKARCHDACPPQKGAGARQGLSRARR